MDMESIALSNSFTNQEITKVNTVINQITSGIKSVTNTGSNLVFTLSDDTTLSVGIIGLSDENFTTILKNKLNLINSVLLNRFTYVNNQLLFDGLPITNGTIDLSEYIKTVDADNKYETKDSSIVKDSNYVHTDVNFAQVDKNKLDTLENFSKDYTELINTPTIPSISGLASESYVDNMVASIPSQDLTPYEKTIDVNTKLANKSDLIHTHEISSIVNLQTALDNRYPKAETMSKEEIQILFNTMTTGMNWKISVATLDDLNAITDMAEGDVHVVTSVSSIYIYSNSTWVNLGSSSNIPLATETNNGQLSKEDKAKLNQIIVANLVTLTQLTDGLATKSDTTHTHDNYVLKEIGKSLVLDTKISEWDAKADLSSVPTKTSQITNDSDFATNVSVDSKIANYQTESQINTKLIDYAKLTDLSNKLVVGNIKAGSNISISVSGNDVSISSSGGGSVDMNTLPTF